MKIFGYTIIKNKHLAAIINREEKPAKNYGLKTEVQDFIKDLILNGFTHTGTEKVGNSELYSFVTATNAVCFFVNYDGSLSTVYKQVNTNNPNTRIELITDSDKNTEKEIDNLNASLKRINKVIADYPANHNGEILLSKQSLEDLVFELNILTAKLQDYA